MAWLYVSGLFFFFFSSRRRHTRFKCDWSSDVCSSDLHRRARLRVGPALRLGAPSRQARALDPRGGPVARTGGSRGRHGLRLMPRILFDEEEEDRRIDRAGPSAQRSSQPEPPSVGLRWVILVAAGAVVPRLVYLFAFSRPDQPGTR